MKILVDWTAVESMIRADYESDRRPRGRPGYSLKMLVRIECLAWMFVASDRALESALADSKSFARFVGLDPWAPKPPSAAAIRNFRALLQRKTGPDGVLSLEWAVHMEFRTSVSRAGLEFRPGEIREPVFRRAISPLIQSAD